LLRQCQRCAGGGEKEAVAGTACEEAHVLVCLAAIRLEVQWQLAVGLAYSSFPSRGCWTSEADEEWEQHEHSARRVLGHDYLALVLNGRLAWTHVCADSH